MGGVGGAATGFFGGVHFVVEDEFPVGAGFFEIEVVGFEVFFGGGNDEDGGVFAVFLIGVGELGEEDFHIDDGAVVGRFEEGFAIGAEFGDGDIFEVAGGEDDGNDGIEDGLVVGIFGG